MGDDTNKVLWAVDPFTTDKVFQFKVAKSVAKVAKNMGCTIEPVCVLSPDQLRVPKSAFTGDGKQYQLEAEKIVKGWVKSLKIPNMIGPRLLMQDEYSVRSSVLKLLDYAQAEQVIFIGVGTHNKKPLHRFFVGSFAETLVLTSQVPVVMISPRAQSDFKPDKVLFPTDFSQKSEKAYADFLVLAKRRRAKVVLFHKVQFDVPPPIYGFDPALAYRDYLQQDLVSKREQAEKWLREAKRIGVSVELVLDEKPGFAVDAIFKAVKKHKCGMIAMASVSGAAAATLLGSISRQVMRHSPCPVWLLHAK